MTAYPYSFEDLTRAHETMVEVFINHPTPAMRQACHLVGTLLSQVRSAAPREQQHIANIVNAAEQRALALYVH